MAFSKSKEWTFRSGMNGLFEVEEMSRSRNELLTVEWMAFFSKSKEWTFRSGMNGLFEVERVNF